MLMQAGQRLRLSTVWALMLMESPFSPEQQGLVLICRHDVDWSHHNSIHHVGADRSETEIEYSVGFDAAKSSTQQH